MFLYRYEFMYFDYPCSKDKDYEIFIMYLILRKTYLKGI